MQEEKLEENEIVEGNTLEERIAAKLAQVRVVLSKNFNKDHCPNSWNSEGGTISNMMIMLCTWWSYSGRVAMYQT